MLLNFRKFVPFTNRVLIKRAEAATKSKGGILIPESSKTEVNMGEVMAVGPGLTLSNGTFRPNAV
jgi:chaperonin GroES